MEWDEMDIDEQFNYFVEYLKCEKYTYEIIEDEDVPDCADDEIIIDYNGKKYALLYSGPNFVFRYDLIFSENEKTKLKHNSKKIKKMFNNCSTSFPQKGDKLMNEMLIFYELKINEKKDINIQFKKYINDMELIVNYILNG